MSSTLYSATYKLDFMAGKLSERINLIISETNSKPAAIAKAAKVSGSTVMYWRNGQTREIKSKYARALAQHFGYSADWLMYGEGPSRPESRRKAATELQDHPEKPYVTAVPTAGERLQRLIEIGDFSEQDLEAIANFISHFRSKKEKE
jgi:transcriptional regulator with XRE-family HTH domain